MSSSAGAGRRGERGLTLVEVVVATAVSTAALLGVFGFFSEITRLNARQAETYHLRTQAAAALRRAARELEQSSAACPDFSATSQGVTFNLPAAFGDAPTWGPAITYRVAAGNVLVREQGTSVERLMGSCVSFQAAVSGARVGLRLKAEGAFDLSGSGAGARRPFFEERLDVVLMP